VTRCSCGAELWGNYRAGLCGECIHNPVWSVASPQRETEQEPPPASAAPHTPEEPELEPPPGIESKFGPCAHGDFTCFQCKWLNGHPDKS